MKKFYFYHVIDKDADLSRGLLSLKYMYDHKMYKEFDENTSKYRERIVGTWNIPLYKNRKASSLTREEILNALNIFRGSNGSRCIYFFRYPLYEELGPRVKNLLKEKDIYRIDLNDKKVMEQIDEVFFGFDGNKRDGKLLDREYYESVTKDEYFRKYDDSMQMNFASLNHISIVFKDDYCPRDLIEKC